MIHEHLTEKLLGEFIDSRIGKLHTIIHNKKFPCNELNFRPDYRIDDLKLVVEFDGYQHYCKYSTQYRDLLKKTEISNAGYRLIRIPYFVQLNSTTAISTIFSDIELSDNPFNDYSHGFIDEKAMRITDFNVFGLNRLISELEMFSFATPDILLSLTQMELNFLEEIKAIKLPTSMIF